MYMIEQLFLVLPQIVDANESNKAQLIEKIMKHENLYSAILCLCPELTHE
jgi:hypothetical protein